jgi:virulence-associated protein VapD
METDQDRVIVAEGAGDRHGVRLVRVHHQDFPDIHAEGETPAIAAAYLAGQLTRILDAPPDSVSRESVERALDDIRLFIQSHEF